MIEFYKYLYGGLRPTHPLRLSKKYPRNSKAGQICPAVQLTSHLSLFHSSIHFGTAYLAQHVLGMYDIWLDSFQLAQLSSDNPEQAATHSCINPEAND